MSKFIFLFFFASHSMLWYTNIISISCHYQGFWGWKRVLLHFIVHCNGTFTVSEHKNLLTFTCSKHTVLNNHFHSIWNINTNCESVCRLSVCRLLLLTTTSADAKHVKQTKSWYLFVFILNNFNLYVSLVTATDSIVCRVAQSDREKSDAENVKWSEACSRHELIERLCCANQPNLTNTFFERTNTEQYTNGHKIPNNRQVIGHGKIFEKTNNIFFISFAHTKSTLTRLKFSPVSLRLHKRLHFSCQPIQLDKFVDMIFVSVCLWFRLWTI